MAARSTNSTTAVEAANGDHLTLRTAAGVEGVAPLELSRRGTSGAATRDALREPFPLMLHREARQTVRKHAWHELRRVGVLLAADVAVLLGFRVLLRFVREQRMLGDTAAEVLNRLAPVHAIELAPTLCAVVLGLGLLGAYRAGDRRRDPYLLFAGGSLGLALVWWARVWSDPTGWTFAGFAVACVVLGSALALTRLALDVVVRRVRPVGGNAARTLLIGSAEDVRRAASNPAIADRAETIVVGQLDSARLLSYVQAGGERLARLISTERVQMIVLLGHVEEPLARDVLDIADAACAQVYRIPDECVSGEYTPRLQWRRGIPMLQLTRPGSRGPQLAFKRLMDISVAAVALVALSPLLAVLAIAVRLSSGGSILFRQERVGIGGRRFHIYKFRTMVADAESHRTTLTARSVYADPRLFKIPDDPRITPVGRILRRTSLDELPQFWNVLRGDMSLVGPRPPVPSEVELYDEQHYRRFVMKPGMTGPWQVSGRNTITDFEEVLKLETAYMRNWSLRKDFEIMVRTLPVVIRMEGAH